MMLLSLALAVPFLAPPQQERVQVQCGVGTQVVVAPETDGIWRCADGAVVTSQDMRVEADWIQFDPATSQLTAGDRFRFTRGKETVNGTRLSFNVETKTGNFADASGQIEGWYLKASDYERRADGTWFVTKPVATACASDCPAWHLTWKDATVTP